MDTITRPEESEILIVGGGLAVLDDLGRLERVSKLLADPDKFELRSSDGRLLARTTLPAEQTLLLESERLRQLRDTVVKHTPLFELSLERRAG